MYKENDDEFNNNENENENENDFNNNEGNSEREDVNSNSNKSERNDLNIIYDVPVNISAVIGCAKIKISQLLKLGRGAIIELDKKVGDPVDIYVNNRIVAKGEIVVVNGNIAITMTEIIKMNI